MKLGRQSIAGRAGALALALWLGGVGCLLCCEKADARAQEGATPQAASHVKAPGECPLHAARSATRESDVETKARAGESSQQRGAARCCRDKGQPVALSFKPRVPLETAAVAPTHAPPTPRASTRFAHEPTPRGRLPDGGATYLRCCILLI